MSKVTVNINEVVAKVEEAYEEVRKTSEIVLKDFCLVKPTADEYRGKYCFPFFSTGDYYIEKEKSSYYDKKGNYHESEYCFMPMPLDQDMRNFVEALRKLDQEIRPLFAWDIRKDWQHESRGNVQVEECDGFCYIGHTYKKIKAGSNREFGVLVGVIAYNVYKDAFLDEILETVKELENRLQKHNLEVFKDFHDKDTDYIKRGNLISLFLFFPFIILINSHYPGFDHSITFEMWNTVFIKFCFTPNNQFIFCPKLYLS